MHTLKTLLDEFRHDARYGLRLLVRSPVFAVVSVLVLGLGIGATATIFTFVSSLIIRPLAIDGVRDLVQIFERFPDSAERQRVAFANFLDWKDQNHAFQNIAAFRFDSITIAGGTEPERILGMRSSASIFPLLHTQMAAGRSYTPEEDRPGAERIAVLTNGFWRSHFGADPNVIGREIRIDGNPVTIVGVLATDPEYFGLARIWTPLALGREANGRSTHFLSTVARLKDGIALQQAQAELDAIASRLTDNRIDGRQLGVLVQPFQDSLLDFIYPALSLAMAAAGLLLLITCANVANLVLARGVMRKKEIAIRTAIGASRFRIVRQLLTEAIVLSAIGALIGALLCSWSVPALIGLSPENQRLVDVRMDQRIVIFVIVIAALTSILFGLTPAIKISRPARFARRHRPRNALIVTEIALAVMLLTGTSLLVKSYLRIHDVSPGIRTQNVLTVEMSIPPASYPNNADVSRFYKRVLKAVNGLPGVDSAATVRTLPFGGRSNFAQFDVRGAPARDSNDQDVLANQQIVSANYFTAAGVRLLAGRFFTDQDGEGAPPVAIINDSLARRVWKNESPVGAQIRIGPPEWGLPWLTIVGVTGNVMHYGLDQKMPLEIYVPFDQVPVRDMALFVATRISPSLLIAGVRQKVYEVDPDQAVSAVRSMQQVIDDSLWQRKVLLWIMLLFAGVALTLSSMAIYGVIAFSVQQRQGEFGIRIALGAQRAHILRIAVGEGMRLVAFGTAFGLMGSAATMRGISRLLYDVQPTDPASFISITILLAAVAFIAAYIPARRATMANLMNALRID